MSRCAALLLFVLPALQGCSTAYEPARSPRVSVVMDGGSPVFLKDGQRSGNLVFGAGLADLVRSNPRAEAEAKLGRNLAIGGFVFDIAGLGSETAGLITLSVNHEPSHDNTVGGVLVIGGIACVAVGAVLLLESPPHIYDAINIYNDGLEAPP
jgi:hypothetical protein